MAEPSDVSTDVCLSCGHCCSGTLFSKVRVAEDQHAVSLRSLGLRLMSEKGVPEFVLPCSCHDGLCTIYSDRPPTCRSYECSLLKATKAGEISLDRAIEIVAALTGKVEEYRAHYSTLLAYDESASLVSNHRRLLERKTGYLSIREFNRTFADALVAFAAINYLIDEYFITARSDGDVAR